jgi:hypothetical protein
LGSCVARIELIREQADRRIAPLLVQIDNVRRFRVLSASLRDPVT